MIIRRKKTDRNENRFEPRQMQFTIMSAFTVVSVSILLAMGIILFISFSRTIKSDTIQSTTNIVNQTTDNLEDYLIGMRQISDTVYYNIIKENDIADLTIQNSINLVYEANKENIKSIAVYSDTGELLLAEPIAQQKENPNVSRQDWHVQALKEPENMHFSAPHIQNLFDDSSRRYYWVVSLSRAIEITKNNTSKKGVLLVDMDYSSVSRILDKVNKNPNDRYYYLCDSKGEIIYHPKEIRISKGLSHENNIVVPGYDEGVHDEYFEGEHRSVIVNSISYTGWKLVGVIPEKTFNAAMSGTRNIIITLILIMIMMLLLINRLVSARIVTITRIVREQNERRKSEIDVLQSQINPHFLYNTLDSITWMIEGEKNDEAVYMISQLARLFRISLSKGKTVIPIKDELQHAKSYMNIQKVRYKDSFEVKFEVDNELLNMSTVKLIMQPILENAIYYGVANMDGDGEIEVSVQRDKKDILITISDNGIGMTKEVADSLLTNKERVHTKGSGVGLINVDNRIRIVFGSKYGLKIESEPDEGTKVQVLIPAIPYDEETRRSLEVEIPEVDDED